VIDNHNFFLLYNITYSFFATIALFVAMLINAKGYNHSIVKVSNVFSILLIIILILLVGLRAYNVGGDTLIYESIWDSVLFGDTKSEFCFHYLMLVIKIVGFSYQYFLLIIAILFFTTVYLAFKKISKYEKVNLFLLLFSFFSFFFCSSLSINVVRQGVSFSFLLLAYVLYTQTGKKKHTLICVVLSVGFHLTSLIPVGLFLFVYICKKMKLIYYYFIYIVVFVLAYIGFGIMNTAPFLLEILLKERRSSYLSEEVGGYQTGFRISFFVFNTIFLIIFSFLYQMNKNIKYELLLKYYLLASCMFFMTFQIAFSDRWGLFSWFAIPVLFSPVFSIENRKNKLHVISVLFLIFIFFFFNVLYK
jgi:hypothetical protein